MSIQGHPDWLTTTLALGDVLLDGSPRSSGGTDHYGPWFVGGWESVQVAIDGNLDGWSGYLQLDWFFDEALTLPAGTMFWHVGAGCFVADIFPNLGPYMKATTFDAGGATGELYPLAIMLRAGGQTRPPAYNAGVLVNITTTLVAGASNTLAVVGYSTGPALFSFHTDAAIWSVDLHVRNSVAGTVSHLRRADQTNSGHDVTEHVTIPGFVPYVTITNGDGVTRNYTWTLTKVF